MTRLEAILERAIERAVQAVEAEASAIIAEVLREKVKAMLEAEASPTSTPTSTPTPTLRAKAKAAMVEATPTLVKEEATPEATPRRRKAKAQATPEEGNLTAILDAAKAALAKYAGVSTPKGKPLPEVLFRRVRKTLEYAQSLGRTDIPALARSALAHIATDPRGVAMGSWQYLAGKLGLPVPVAQGE